MIENLKVLLVVIATLGLYTWLANAIPQVESVVPEDLTFSADVSEAELIAAGQDLFGGAGQCRTCHGLGTQAPYLLTDNDGTGSIGQRCASRVPGQDCKTYLLTSMLDPEAYMVEGYNPIMPEQDRILTMPQIWALIAYMQSVGGEVTVTGADLREGEGTGATPEETPAGLVLLEPGGASTDPLVLMEDNLCFACHTLAGRGVQLGPTFDGIGNRLSSDDIRRAILDPAADASEGFESLTEVMLPTFGETLTAAQLEIIVQYLTGLR